MYVKFVSDSEGSAKGFSATYVKSGFIINIELADFKIVIKSTECSKRYTASSGIITSPFFPNGTSGKPITCEYVLHAEHQHDVFVLNFTTIDLGRPDFMMLNCSKNYIRVRETIGVDQFQQTICAFA